MKQSSTGFARALGLLGLLTAWKGVSHAAPTLEGVVLPPRAYGPVAKDAAPAIAPLLDQPLHTAASNLTRRFDEDQLTEEQLQMIDALGVNLPPTVDDCVAQVVGFGAVRGGTCLFYSGIGAPDQSNAIIKQWYCSNIQALGTDPFSGRPVTAGVSFDSIVNTDWYNFWNFITIEADALETITVDGRSVATNDMLNQHVSQAMAEECEGVVYFFAYPQINGIDPVATSVWGGWELPALVLNSDVLAIVQVNPLLPFQAANAETGLVQNPALIWSSSDGNAQFNPPLGNTVWFQDQDPNYLG